MKFLVLAAILFSFLACGMHLVFFPLRLHRLYNPGLFSAVFLLTPVSIRHLVLAGSAFGLLNLILAICWILLHYRIGFRSPWYQRLGRNDPKCAFSGEDVKKGLMYLPKSKCVLAGNANGRQPGCRPFVIISISAMVE